MYIPGLWSLIYVSYLCGIRAVSLDYRNKVSILVYKV